MKLARLDTQRIVNPQDIGYPKDSFVASAEVEIEWDEEREVVYLRKLKPPTAAAVEAAQKAKKPAPGPQKALKAIIPLDNVAFMWPLPE